MTLAKRASQRKKAPEAPVEPADLLAWYDRHRRILPWRARRGERANPYRVWLSEIMLQQTTVKAVAPYFARFLARWPTVEALAAANLEDVLREWAGLGYYARARNLHACAKEVVRVFGGEFPDDLVLLQSLPGVGRYTASAIAAIAYEAPVIAVDGNVERVVSRVFALEDELPAAKLKLYALADLLKPLNRFGDFTQALMDLGATICTPKKPACALCPWNSGCSARLLGTQESFPRKAPKREGQLRRGAAFVAARDDGYVLLRRRPEKGLLGGMSEVPGSEWRADFDLKKALVDVPLLAHWRRRAGVVSHVFTHFPLELTVFVGAVLRGTRAPKNLRWVRISALSGEALPNVMRKVIAHALGSDSGGENGRKLK